MIYLCQETKARRVIGAFGTPRRKDEQEEILSAKQAILQAPASLGACSSASHLGFRSHDIPSNVRRFTRFRRVFGAHVTLIEVKTAQGKSKMRDTHRSSSF